MSNTTSYNGTSNESNKFKTYLIEKLLNETPPTPQVGSMEPKKEEVKIQNQNLNLNRSESKEDLASETGTYTIDENPDVEDEQHKPVGEIRPTPNAMEIITARAAIDEKFGIVPNVSDQEPTVNLKTSMTTKRSPQKVVRLRNKTYSLTKDVLDAAGTNSTEGTMVAEMSPVKEQTRLGESLEQAEQPVKQPFLLSSSSASSSSTSMLDTNARLKKTTTYEIIATNAVDNESNAGASARTVATEMLLGDTEKLIEQLKKRRMEKKQHLKPTMSNSEPNQNSNNNNNNLSSSSASSSSTNLSTKQTGQSWTIPSHDDDDPTVSTRATVDFDPDVASTGHKIGTGGLAFDFIMYNDHLQHGLHRQHNTSSPINRSLPHETNVDTESSVSTNPSVASSTPFSSLTLTKRFELKRSQQRHKPDDTANSCVSTSGETVALASPKSNATSALSLGAKIQTKAKENQVERVESPRASSQARRRSSETGLMQPNVAMTPPTPTPVQYTNRTLFLRQQTAKAKRNSLEKSQVRSSNDSSESYRTTSSLGVQKTNNGGILKKPTTPPTQPPTFNGVSRSKTANSNLKTTSRSNSRTRSPFGSNNSLMTSSLNLPANTSLPTSMTGDSFYKRKSYDPVKAVELDKLKRQHQQQQLLANGTKISKQSPLMTKKNLNTSNDKLAAIDHLSLVNMQHNGNNNNNEDLSDFSFQSLSSQFSSLSVDTSRDYEKIMQSTLQRLCIKLIQMSTGVLDKIGDNSTRTICDSIQYPNTSELERMQILAKLVHSIQLVHDHIEFIDSTLFNTHKSEDNYIKELSKIRKEVDILKQSAALNSPSTTKLRDN